MVDVGDEIPDIRLDSQVGLVTVRDLFDGKWGIVMTFGLAFDPVGTTDIGLVCKLVEEFEARNIVVVGIGMDTVANYRKWIKDIEELQAVRVTIPLLSDTDGSALRQLSCARVTPSSGTRILSHGLFMVDIDRIIRSSFRYSPSTGRNFYETLRLFDALHLVTHHRVVCPANWASGQEVMLHPQITPEEAAEFRFAEIKPWFRLTAAPDS